MKLSASSNALLKALTTVGGVVPSKHTLPILDCILFEQINEDLRLSATNLDISIVQHIQVSFDSDASGIRQVAIPARRLLDTLRALPEVPVRMEVDDGFKVMLRTDAGEYKMMGYDGADYPNLPDLEPEQRIEIRGSTLRRAIESTSFAVSKDTLRPAMMGVYFQIHVEGGRAVATDGHRLVKIDLASLKAEKDLDFIVPEKALSLCGKVDDKGICTILVDERYVGFDFGHLCIFARQISESYPNYEAVIPRDNDKRIVVDRDALSAAVKRVSLYSSSITHQIRLSVESGQIEISAQDTERSSEAHETVPCEYDHDSMLIGFNATYLNEVLHHIQAEEAVLAFSTPNRAGVITPHSQHEGEHLMILIMPVMLNV